MNSWTLPTKQSCQQHILRSLSSDTTALFYLYIKYKLERLDCIVLQATIPKLN